LSGDLRQRLAIGGVFQFHPVTEEMISILLALAASRGIVLQRLAAGFGATGYIAVGRGSMVQKIAVPSIDCTAEPCRPRNCDIGSV
jgi:hypothetical protein